MSVDPPPGDRRAGSARTVTVSAAADPMGSSSFSLVAPPENAVTCARPERPSPVSFTVTLPFWVRASAGSMRPSVVVNETTVPFWTAVPADSITVATMSVEPFGATDVAAANSVIVDSVGAVSGTLSQAMVVIAMATSAQAARRKVGRSPRAIIAKSIMKPCS